MKTYEEYIKVCVECTEEICNEEKYKEITSRFKDVDISFDDFNPYDDELEYYIVRQLLIEKFGDYFWVDDIYGNQIDLELNTLEIPDILDDVKEFLESFGYTFVNYDSLKEELLEKAESDATEELYHKAKLLIDDFSSDELKEFIEKYGARN